MSRLGKCVLVLSLALSLTFFVVAPSAWAANPWGGPTDIAGSIALGTGIPADPYQISDPSELAYMAQEVNLGNSSYDDESYILTADLNMNGGLYYWTQIGTYTDRFEGNFNGNNHTISNLSINTPAVSCIGLFGFAQGGAVIENVVLANVNITGDMYVGTLVGSLLAGTVLNCAVTTGSVNGSFSVGGLVGDMGASSQVDRCTAGVNVTGAADEIGGLVGLSGGSITNSAASGSVSGQDFTGGLIGYTSGAVSNSAASGSVSGQNAIGGLVGTSYAGGTVSNSAAIGDVSGTLEVGGLMGNDTGGTISGSAASGGVSGPSTVGGFIGWKDNVGGVSNNLSSGRVSGGAPIGSFAGRVLSPGTNVTGNAFDSQEGAA
ncbi:MAG: hypothetical protein LBS93_03755, partial [Synergistaceae bacterium]|nr:hypothetical protein [Synergistaceae bacterium]